MPDTRTSERVAELWDGEGTSVEGGPFARRATTENGDAQLAGTTNRSGFTRPLIWRPRSGERRDLRLDELDGDVAPLDWSRDGDRLLLLQTSRAQRRLWIYDVAGDALHEMAHPPGYFGNLLWTRWRDLRDLGGRGPPDTRHRSIPTRAHSAARCWLRGDSAGPAVARGDLCLDRRTGDPRVAWVPEGEGPFPTILYTHGGPESVQTEEFSPEAQAGWITGSPGFRSTIAVRPRSAAHFSNKSGATSATGSWRTWSRPTTGWCARLPTDKIFLSGWSYGGY